MENRSNRLPFFLILCSSLWILVPGPVVVGQVKYEKESRIKAEAIPVQAREWVRKLLPAARIKWFREESIEGQSIEAKSKWNNEKYSIEFDTNGILEDVEVEVTLQSLPLHVKDGIMGRLGADFFKHRVVKVQKQLSGSSSEVLDYFLKRQEGASLRHQYELVAEGKSGQAYRAYEYTFSREGDFISRSLIVYRNTDNLEY